MLVVHPTYGPWTNGVAHACYRGENADELAELSRAEAVLREDRFLDEESTVS